MSMGQADPNSSRAKGRSTLWTRVPVQGCLIPRNEREPAADHLYGAGGRTGSLRVV